MGGTRDYCTRVCLFPWRWDLRIVFRFRNVIPEFIESWIAVCDVSVARYALDFQPLVDPTKTLIEVRKRGSNADSDWLSVRVERYCWSMRSVSSCLMFNISITVPSLRHSLRCAVDSVSIKLRFVSLMLTLTILWLGWWTTGMEQISTLGWHFNINNSKRSSNGNIQIANQLFFGILLKNIDTYYRNRLHVVCGIVLWHDLRVRDNCHQFSVLVYISTLAVVSMIS